jgi:lantibiotic modifying enzyme
MSDSHQIFLEMADFLGARLCRDAIWAGSRCNWLGAGTIESTGGRRTAAHRACGPDLYAGTTGIAVFLAHLYAATGESVFSLTAEGAIRQALSRLDDFQPALRIGFYAGLTGIAYVLNELAEILDLPKFGPMARLILEDIGKGDPDVNGLDVISGSAGAIPALLKIYRKQPDDFFLELAIKHGDHLLRVSRKDYREGRCDAGVVFCRSGFAQGIDGVACALLELYQTSGRNDFRHAAEQAFQKERCRPGAESKDQSEGQKEIKGSATWFDGASGIGLTRLRAFEVLGDDSYLSEAKANLDRGIEGLSASSGSLGNEDFSLAHGRPGVAELFLCAIRVLKHASHKTIAEQVGLEGIERYRKTDSAWPCGTPGGSEAPNLMLGLAGIGYFYLRLHDAVKTPSLLMMLP